jgi:hypothetical protein
VLEIHSDQVKIAVAPIPDHAAKPQGWRENHAIPKLAMSRPITLNRFPLFGLFAHQAARQMGYPEDDARLLGYSTALLYAIYKAKSQAGKGKAEREPKQKRPKEIEVKTDTLQFGGQAWHPALRDAGTAARAISN